MPSNKNGTLVVVCSIGSVAAGAAGAWIWYTSRKAKQSFLGRITIDSDKQQQQQHSQDRTTVTTNGDPTDHNNNNNIHLNVPSPPSVLHLMESRRSFFTKQFSGKAVSDQVIADMMEAARWAPSHHLTQPWHFVILTSDEHKHALGQLLASLYKQGCERSGKPMITAKYEKKQQSPKRASHIIAICCNVTTKNPLVEEICSVAMAVQNMHLMATSYNAVGAYWSSSGIYNNFAPPPTTIAKGSNSVESTAASTPSLLQAGFNPPALVDFLGISPSEHVCLGWFFVGDISHLSLWPQGRRGPCSVSYLNTTKS